MFEPNKSFVEWLKTKSPGHKKSPKSPASPNIKADTPHPDRKILKRSPSIGKDIPSPTPEEFDFMHAMLEKERVQRQWQLQKLRMSQGSPETIQVETGNQERSR